VRGVRRVVTIMAVVMMGGEECGSYHNYRKRSVTIIVERR
jgi:hypothetical protein